MPNDIAVDHFGNVYVTGYSEGIGYDRDYITIKYDSTGKEQWVSRYNGPGNAVDMATDLAVEEASNVYVTGGIDGDHNTMVKRGERQAKLEYH
ncbi:SBBP repeat-containing protein [candidate division KSB1 bacterium]|nr:SBBP repeat-containing protein [candidate division KSB1 bacterium]